MVNAEGPGSYFAMAFKGDFEEAITREISIPDTNPLRFEKYILEHLAGYLLDLSTASDLELANLSKDADAYILDRLKQIIAKEVKVRRARNRVAENQRKGIPPALVESVEYIAEMPDDDIYDHGTYTLSFKNVNFSIKPPFLKNYSPGHFDSRIEISLNFHFSASGIARIRQLIKAEDRDSFEAKYTCETSSSDYYYPSRPASADTFICLEDRGKTFRGTFYDLWQGLWYISTGIPPRHSTRRGYRNFLEFCDVDDKSYVPSSRSGTWPFFAPEWLCTKAVVRAVNYWNDTQPKEKRQRDEDDSEEEEVDADQEEEVEGKGYIETIEQLHAVSIAMRIERGEYIKPY